MYSDCVCRLVGGDSGGRGGKCTVTRVDVGGRRG